MHKPYTEDELYQMAIEKAKIYEQREFPQTAHKPKKLPKSQKPRESLGEMLIPPPLPPVEISQSRRNFNKALIVRNAVKGGRLKGLGSKGYVLCDIYTRQPVVIKGIGIGFRGINEAVDYLTEHDGEKWGSLDG